VRGRPEKTLRHKMSLLEQVVKVVEQCVVGQFPIMRLIRTYDRKRPR